MAGNTGAIDLDGMTVSELVQLRDAAEAKRLEKLEGEKNAVLNEARAKLKALGLPFDDFFKKPMTSAATRKETRGTGKKAAVKFRNQATGETWSGRGREPAWIKGQDRDAFTVKG